MTPTEIALVVILTLAVSLALYAAMKRAASSLLDGLSADAGLDAEPCHQPRASTNREPSDVEALCCVVFLIFAIAALGLLWCGFADGMVRWMAAHVVAMHPR